MHILAVGTRNRGIIQYQVGRGFKHRELIVGARLQRRIGTQVILQVLHVGHAAGAPC